MISSAKLKPSIQNGGVGGGDVGGEGEYRIINNKTILVRERERKLRSAFAKYKKWDEAERCNVELLENNRIMVNNNVIINMDHSNYVREKDVTLDLDEDYRTCVMPPLPCIPPSHAVIVGGDGVCNDCDAASCRLGCICESIKREPVVRTHCGKSRCFFECTCQQSMFNNGDDGDIRSRLRPRVSLLNWRFMEPTERDKDPPPVNYRQLERGVAVYPRMRRVPVAPQRFRNEYIMSSKFKDTFHRERRKPGGAIKIFRKQPAVGGVKRDAQGAIFRRNYSMVKNSVKQKENSIPRKMNVRPCSVAIDALKPDRDAEEEESPVEPPDQQTPLKIPNLVKIIQRDGMIVLMGLDAVCYVTFSLQFKIPAVMVYKAVAGDKMEIPWLYLPFTSSGESWLFHPIQTETESTFTCIPEINCVIPSMALRTHITMCKTSNKTVALKMLWVGKDTKKRQGSIYILPALPTVLICGPFPHYLMTTRFNPEFERVERISQMCSLSDQLNSEMFAGSMKSWGKFLSLKKGRANTGLQAKIRKTYPPKKTAIPQNVLIEMAPECILGSGSPSPDEEEDSMPDEVYSKPDKLRVSWNDAAKLLSVPV